MSCFHAAKRSVLLAACLIGFSVSAEAASWDRFDGAWAVEGESCSKVFATKGGRTSFARRQSTDLPGFIVQNGMVRGLTSQCSVASRKDVGDVMKVLLHCRSQIMFGDMTVSVKIKDDDTISRVDPDFPEVATTYHRCK